MRQLDSTCFNLLFKYRIFEFVSIDNDFVLKIKDD